MKKHEASYTGYVYEKPMAYWTPKKEVIKQLTKVDFNKNEKIEKGGLPEPLIVILASYRPSFLCRIPLPISFPFRFFPITLPSFF